MSNYEDHHMDLPKQGLSLREQAERKAQREELHRLNARASGSEDMEPPRPATRLEELCTRLEELNSYAGRVLCNVIATNERLTGSTPGTGEAKGPDPGFGTLDALDHVIGRLEEAVTSLDHEVTDLGTKV